MVYHNRVYMNPLMNYAQIQIKQIHIITPYLRVLKAYFNILIPSRFIPGKLLWHASRYTSYSYTSTFWHLGGSCARISPLDYLCEENEITFFVLVVRFCLTFTIFYKARSVWIP
jgi:hypothetical protein